MKFDNIFSSGESLVYKENLIFEEEKSKIRCLKTQLDFFERLIEFIKGLIARKLIFKLI